MTGVMAQQVLHRQISPTVALRRPLRIAMVTTFYPPCNFGGDGHYVRRLAHALVRRGHEVEVIHDADAYHLLSGGVEPEPLAEPEGLILHSLRSSAPALSCLATQQLGRPLVHGRRIRRILARGFDVIHFHNISLAGGPGILSYGEGIKLYTAHEHWLVCPMHTLWRHNRELCTGRQCWRCALAYKRPPQFWRSGDLLTREACHIDAFIALSEFSAQKHAEFGFKAPMVVCPSFLPDINADERVQAPTEGKLPYVLFVGRLERIKGLQEVIPAFDEKSPAELLIAGSGGYESHLRALARGRPVHFLGYQTSERLRTLYAGACALIASSVCYEAFPLVVLEAFQLGVPVIAPRLGPYPEIVETSRGGVIFQDCHELKAAIHTLATDKRRRERMGNAAKRAFKERWSEEVGLKVYLDLIRKMAEKRKISGVQEAFVRA
jgi:glycosyltransferase involved in cell wall biosynthesis